MKPRVLFVADQPDWAFARVAEQVKRTWGHQYDIEIIPYTGTPRNHDVDTVCWMWWKAAIGLNLHMKVEAKRTCCGMYDNYTIRCDPDYFKAVASITDCFFAGNETIAADLRRRCPQKQIVLVEDGVDLELFKPMPLPQEFTVGWAGNNMYEVQRLGDLKGVRLIKEACRLLRVPLVIQDRQEGMMLHTDMPEGFYREISCYCCASESEGTPNTVMEALACGRTVVSTNVGQVPKLVQPGRTGFIVGRTVGALITGIEDARQLGPRVKECSDSMKPWSWRKKALAYGAVIGEAT